MPTGIVNQTGSGVLKLARVLLQTKRRFAMDHKLDTCRTQLAQ